MYCLLDIFVSNYVNHHCKLCLILTDKLCDVRQVTGTVNAHVFWVKIIFLLCV